ncbi:MAG TPA: HYR domain-containing protein, partial [Fibrella sp.]
DQCSVTLTAPTATDNCAGTVTATTSDPTSYSTQGTYTVNWTYSDGNGNTTNQQQSVVVDDTQAPVISGCPTQAVTVQTGSGNNSCSQTASWTAPTATDNCGGAVAVSSNYQPGATFPVGTTTVTYTFTDAENNSSTCSFNVVVEDNTAPVIACPANITVNNTPGTCGAAVTYTATVTDNCLVPGTLSNATATNTNTGQNGVFFDLKNLSSDPVTITALKPMVYNDGSQTNTSFSVYRTTAAGTYVGKESNASVWTLNTTQSVPMPGASVTAQRTITLSTPIVLQPGEIRGIYLVTTTGYGGGPVSYLSTAGSPAYTGTNTLQNGTLQMKAGIGSSTAFGGFFGTAGSTTNFRMYWGDIVYNSITPQLTSGLPSGSTFPVGTTTNTLSATDAAGNTSTCSFTVTVVDNEAPVLSVPQNATVSCEADNSPAATGTATATDNCSATAPTVTYSDATTPGSCAYSYTITRSWTATDGATVPNVSTQTQTITVQDVTAPVATCKPASVTLANGTASITPAMVLNTASDNCTPASGLIYSVSPSTFNCTQAGTVVPVTLTVTDACGNFSTCQANVTVNGSRPTASITINPPVGSAAVGNTPANPVNPTTPYLMFIGYGAQTVNLTASAATASGTITGYAWSEPNSNVVSHLSSATATNPSFNPANTQGSFTRIVTVTNSFGCTASRSVEMCVRDIRVPGAVPKGSYPKVHMCKDGTTAAQVPTNQVVSFQNSGYVLGQCNMIACNSSNLTQMRSIAGRDGEDGMNEVVEAVAELGMAVYPNPSNSQFTLRISSTTADKADVRVLDLSGRVVERLPATPTNTEVRLGRELSPGVYFVEVR